MFYIDTSVIVAYYCPEALSQKAEDFLMAHANPVISHLIEVEMFSAVSRKIREGGLDKRTARRILAKFMEHVDGRFYTNLLLGPHHFRLARDWIALFNTGMRSLDALHLAVASIQGCSLVTADRDLAESAEIIGLEVEVLD
jgi:uncharacterized protein